MQNLVFMYTNSQSSVKQTKGKIVRQFIWISGLQENRYFIFYTRILAPKYPCAFHPFMYSTYISLVIMRQDIYDCGLSLQPDTLHDITWQIRELEPPNFSMSIPRFDIKPV